MQTDRRGDRTGPRPNPVLGVVASIALLLAVLSGCSAPGGGAGDPIASEGLPAKCQAALGTTAPPTVVGPPGDDPSPRTDVDGDTDDVAARAHLRGRVVDGLCRTPIAGAGVAFFTDLDGFAPSRSTITDAEGRFDVELTRDRYRVAFNQSGLNYTLTWYPAAGDQAGGREVPLRGDTDLGDLELFHPEDQPVPELAGDGGRRIVVIGDSLVQQSTTRIARRLDLIGPASVRGISNQRIDQMQPTAERYAALDPDTVVIALGSNDANQGHPLAESIAALETMVSTFDRARCVVVVDVNTLTPRAAFDEHAEALNQRFERLASRHPHVHIASWNAAVGALLRFGPASTWFTDGIHLTANGIEVYARTISDAVAGC